MIKDYISIISRNFARRKLRGWLTILGICIGIASVVSLIGLGEGLRAAINSQFGFLGTDIMSVTASGGMGPPGTGVINPLTNTELEEIRKVQGVEQAAGRIMESGKLWYNDRVGFGYAVSMPDGEERKLIEHLMNLKAQKGRLLEDGDGKVVLLGAKFYEEDNGFGEPIKAGSKIKLNDAEFKVIGILEKKGNFQLDGAVFINEKALRDLVDRPGKDYDMIAVKFNEKVELGKIQSDIEKRLRTVRKVKEGEEDFSVQTPAQILASVNDVLLGIQIFVYIIAGISILVGGIGIMNTMYTSVVERTKQIGIMKAIGAKNRTVFSLFFIESGLLGTVGGAAGVLIGVIIASALSFIGRLALGSDLIAAQFSFELLFGAILFSFIIGSIFGTVPAIRASKLNPVDAMRFTT